MRSKWAMSFAGQRQPNQRETRPSRRIVGPAVNCPGGRQPD